MPIPDGHACVFALFRCGGYLQSLPLAGHPSNIICPGRGVNMGDGWETARKVGLQL